MNILNRFAIFVSFVSLVGCGNSKPSVNDVQKFIQSEFNDKCYVLNNVEEVYMVKHGDMYKVKFNYDLTNLQDIPMEDLGRLPASALNNLPIACDGDNCQWWQECLTDKDDLSLIKTLISAGATKAGSKLQMVNELDMVKSDKGWISER